MSKCETCLYWPKCEEYPFDESGCNDYRDNHRIDNLIHFLKTEMRITAERQNTYHTVYDGAEVGWENTKQLLKNHYRFCEHMLKILGEEVSDGT